MNKSLLSSDKMDWATPQKFFDDLNEDFCFTVDVCASEWNAKLKRFWSVSDDALSLSWRGEVCFMNPPYGRQIKDWVKKAYEESRKGAVVENVISYYGPLIKPVIVDNHYFWANFNLSSKRRVARHITDQDIESKELERGFYLSKYDLPKRYKRKLLNNCVYPKVGKHIFDCAFSTKQMSLLEVGSHE